MAISEQSDQFVHPLIQRINRSKPAEVAPPPPEPEKLPMRLYNMLMGRHNRAQAAKEKAEGEEALKDSLQTEFAVQAATQAALQAIKTINDPKINDPEAVALRTLVPQMSDTEAVKQDVLKVLETFPAGKAITPDVFMNYYRDVLNHRQKNLTPGPNDAVRPQSAEVASPEKTITTEKKKWIEVRKESAKQLFFDAGYAEYRDEHAAEYLSDLYDQDTLAEPSPASVKLYIDKVKQERAALRDRLRGIEDRANDQRFAPPKR